MTGEGIIDAFSQLLRTHASRPLVSSPGRAATVADLEQLSHEILSGPLAALRPGQLVGLAAPNGPAFLAGYLALRRADSAVLLLDPMAPAEDRQRVVDAIGASAILDCAEPWPDSEAAFRLSLAEPGGSRPATDGIDVVKITSGSTGIARGVAVTTSALMADESALAGAMGLGDDDRLLASIPFSHSYGFTTLVLSALVRGLPLVLPANRGPFSALDAARELEATVFPTAPAYIQALLKLSPPPEWPATIRLVISAGAQLLRTTAAQFRSVFGQPVHVFYGSSECGGITYDRDGSAAERGTVGSPVDGVRVSLKAAASSPADEGIVVVESMAVGHTYLPLPDGRLQAGRFESSDLATWTGRELTLRGRVDAVINVRGRKVDPLEVESVLRALDGVHDVVVLGSKNADGPDETVRAVIACSQERRRPRDVMTWCQQRLADYKVPRSIVFVDVIPRTARGKLDRRALLALAANDAPEPVPPPQSLPWRPTPLIIGSVGLHAAALAGVAAFPETWEAIFSILVGNHALVAGASVYPRGSWLGPNVTRLPEAAAQQGVVALTFDDGPDPEVTPAVLELLEQANVRATFFCIGQRAEAHKDLVALTTARGHGVENHTFRHRSGFAFGGPQSLRREIQRGQIAIERASGRWPTLFRAPAGMQNPWLSRVLAQSGLSMVSWTRRGFDTVTRDSAAVVARLTRDLRGGDILLLHDTPARRDGSGRPVVLDSLRRVLDAMAARGLRSEALHRLLPVPHPLSSTATEDRRYSRA